MRAELLRKMASANVTTKADRITDGIYEMSVKKIMVKDGESGTFFIGELRVDKSTAKHDTIKPNQVGSTVGFAFNIGSSDQKHKSAMGNAKAFVLALQEDPNMSQEDFIACTDLLTNESNPAAGMKLKCETFRTKTRAGGDFVGCNWFHIEQTEDEIKANAATL